ncbi:MAG: branched-chain amino acid ABC transporter permease [Syntrophomonadales bacterium]|jgi:branched-chain amino acid transport system permease protein
MKKTSWLDLAAIVVVVIFLYWAQSSWDSYSLTILRLVGINLILGLSMNLINGFTGQFSLGHAGFMAVGAYTVALLTMPVAVKQMNFFMVPQAPFLANIVWPYLPSMLMAGLMAAIFGLIIGIPVLRLRGDYLAIATLGFAEVIRVVIVNIKPITNGALGLKAIPTFSSLWWIWGTAIVTVLLMKRLVNSSYGLALKAITEDEVAAEAMGVKLFYHKLMSFTLSAFLAGIGGALLAAHLGTVDPSQFNFMLTFNILLIAVLGGLGSVTGSVIAAAIVTVGSEWLRIVESPISLGVLQIPGISGMRMVIFSFLLIVVIIYYQQGLMGRREISWKWIFSLFRRRSSEVKL